MSPLRVLALFSAITAEDCILLDVADRPEYLIMTHIPVPPVCIRPSVEMDSGQGSNEDDLTVRLRVRFPTSVTCMTVTCNLFSLSCKGFLAILDIRPFAINDLCDVYSWRQSVLEPTLP